MSAPPIIIGVDEVGRGPLYGNVYAAAVALTPEIENNPHIKDSKKISSEKKRAVITEFIRTNANHAVSYRTAARIDEINILQASQEAMHESIYKLIEQILANADTCSREDAAFHLLIDGNYFVPYVHTPLNIMDESIRDALAHRAASLPAITWECMVGGDGKSKAIAAASIIAKTAHDEYIGRECLQNPELQEKYGLLQNRGYGTKRHLDGIRSHGPSEHHRYTFRPMKES